MEKITEEDIKKYNEEGWALYYEEMYEKIGERFEHLDYGEGVNYKGQLVDDQVLYSLTFRTGSLNDIYDEILRYCVKEGIKNVFDIGMAYAWQSDMFLLNDIEYYGVDLHVGKTMRNFHEDYYFEGFYEETKIDVPEDTVGIAVLSIGWNVYAQAEEEIIKQFTKLREDFARTIVYIPKQSVDVIKHLFKEVRLVKEGSTSIYELIV